MHGVNISKCGLDASREGASKNIGMIVGYLE
jgi:hypothetical protein